VDESSADRCVLHREAAIAAVLRELQTADRSAAGKSAARGLAEQHVAVLELMDVWFPLAGDRARPALFVPWRLPQLGEEARGSVAAPSPLARQASEEPGFTLCVSFVMDGDALLPAAVLGRVFFLLYRQPLFRGRWEHCSLTRTELVAVSFWDSRISVSIDSRRRTLRLMLRTRGEHFNRLLAAFEVRCVLSAASGALCGVAGFPWAELPHKVAVHCVACYALRTRQCAPHVLSGAAARGDGLLAAVGVDRCFVAEGCGATPPAEAPPLRWPLSFAPGALDSPWRPWRIHPEFVSLDRLSLVAGLPIEFGDVNAYTRCRVEGCDAMGGMRNVLLANADQALRNLALHSALPHHANVLPVVAVVERSDVREALRAVYPLADASLATMVERGGPLRPETVRRMLVQLLRGLEHLHANGVLHRAMRPTNVLVFEGGRRFVVSDFFLQRTAPAADGRGLVCDMSRVEVTASMLPPESIAEPQSAVARMDESVDLWMMGLTAWFALTGERISSGGAWRPVEALRGIAWLPLVAACNAPDRAARPRASRLREQLETFHGGDPSEEEALARALAAAEGNKEIEKEQEQRSD
jgi:hypothetical protein